MNVFKSLFQEKCPTCKKTLITDKSDVFHSIVRKSCPEQHYEKEFHPALETYIERYKAM